MRKTEFIAVRVAPEVVRSLDEVASQRGISRSTLVRELLTNCHSFYNFLESEKARQQTDKIILDGNLSQWILNHMPESMTPDWVHFLGEVMHHVADEMVAKEEGGGGESSTNK
jgi:predicted transcriptional regulator